MPRYKRVIEDTVDVTETAQTETDRMWRRIDPIVHAKVQQYRY